jgi:hypothetical protein
MPVLVLPLAGAFLLLFLITHIFSVCLIEKKWGMKSATHTSRFIASFMPFATFLPLFVLAGVMEEESGARVEEEERFHAHFL